MNLSKLKDLLPGKPLKNKLFYRMVNAEYSSQIDEIGHSILTGWRYNPKGEFGVLYLASHPKCAFKEKLKQAFGKSVYLRPQVLGSFTVTLKHVLDLTDMNIVQLLGTSVTRLTAQDDFSEPQAIARDARNMGFEGMIVPSAVGEECTNLVVFKDHLSRNSFCELKKTKTYKTS
ncbi:MAG: RES family NAD+ phosphorylase [Elusimicrobiota bacterium]